MLKEIVIGKEYINRVGENVVAHSKVLDCVVFICDEKPYVIKEDEAILHYKEVPKKPKRYWLFDVKSSVGSFKKSDLYLDDDGKTSSGSRVYEKKNLLKKHKNEFIDVDENGEVVYG